MHIVATTGELYSYGIGLIKAVGDCIVYLHQNGLVHLVSNTSSNSGVFFFILLFLTVKHFAGPSFDNYTMSCSMQGKKVKNCDFNNWAKVTSFFVCSFCLSLALSLGVRITSGILTIERVKCMAGPRICGTVSSRSPNSESVLFRSLNSIRVSYLSKWVWFSAYGYVK